MLGEIAEWRTLSRPGSIDETVGEDSTAKSLQSCPTLCDPIDGIPPGPREYQIARTHKKETT